MAFFLAQASGLLGGSFPWSVNSVLSSTSSESAVAADFNAAFVSLFTATGLAPYIPPSVSLTATSVSTASATFKQTTKTTIPGSHVGTSTSPSLPYFCSPVVTWRTANATRWGRGRWYLFPLATNALATGGNVILPAAQTALQSALNAYWTAVGTNYIHVILHPKATSGGTRPANSTDPVTAADIPNTFSVQSRRGDKLVPSRLSVTL
jgi:hypothetical protein